MGMNLNSIRNGRVSDVIESYEEQEDEMNLEYIHFSGKETEEELDEEKEESLKSRRDARKQKNSSRFIKNEEDEEQEEKAGRLERSMREISRSNRRPTWRS